MTNFQMYVAEFMRKNFEQLYQQYDHYKYQSSQKLFQWNIPKKESDYATIISKLKNDMESVYRAKNFKQVV